jgi:hypothetical protein
MINQVVLSLLMICDLANVRTIILTASKSSRETSTDGGQSAMSEPKSESVPATMRDIFTAITRLTDAFCREYLTAEYATLCRQLTAALARK